MSSLSNNATSDFHSTPTPTTLNVTSNVNAGTLMNATPIVNAGTLMTATCDVTNTAIHSTTTPAVPSQVPVDTSPAAGSNKRKRYTDAAKQIAIYLGLHSTPAQAARELQINRALISKWKREFPAPEKRQFIPAVGAEEPRELDLLISLKPAERSRLENCAVFRHELSTSPGPKRQRNNAVAGIPTEGEVEGEGEGEGEEQNAFAEFWEVDGLAERYLEELEGIPESALDETITLQLEKRVDPTLSAGARLLVEQSLDYALRLRTQNKSEATNLAWQPRKRRFLMFWHRLQLLTNELPIAAAEDNQRDEPSVDEEIDTSFDLQLTALDESDDIPDEPGEPANKVPLVSESDVRAESPLRTVLATEDALLTWLRYDVLKSSPNRGYENIMQDIKAIADLFHDQQTAGLLPPTAKNPRSGQAVKAFLKRISRKRTEIESKQYKDVGLHGIDMGYSEVQQVNIAKYFLLHSRSQKEGWARRADFIISHAICGRSEDLRKMCLRSLYSHELPNERPSSQRVLVFRMNKSKTNQENRQETGVAMRHKDVFVCPIGALALLFFQRWHVSKEAPPSFASRRSWYDLKLFPHQNSQTDAWGYDDQRRSLKAAFAANNITSPKVTHTMRFVSAQWAKAAGCSEDSIRIHGRWCSDRMVERYLSPVSLQPIRALAGFNLNGGNIWISRDLVKPPQLLEQQIFPWATECLAAVKRLPKAVSDVGAQKFLELVLSLRSVLLQDVVLMKAQYPECDLFRHPIFASAAFEDFARDLQEAITTRAEPYAAAVTDVIPVVGNAIMGLQAEVRTSATVQQQIVNTQGNILAKLDDLSISTREENGRAVLASQRIEEELRRMQAEISTNSSRTIEFCRYIGEFPRHIEHTERRANCSDGHHAQGFSDDHNITGSASQPRSSDGNSDSAENIQQNTGEEEVRNTGDGEDQEAQTTEMPRHRLKRNVDNIRELWREWTDGVDNGPSIRNLENRWGPDWRNWSTTESSHFSRRKVIWAYIQKRADELCVPASEIVERLESVRKDKKLSVSGIGEVIKGKHTKHARTILE